MKKDRMSVDEYRTLHNLEPLDTELLSKKTKSKIKKLSGGTGNKVMGIGPTGERYYYDSGLEAEYAQTLIGRKMAKEIVAWYPQVMFPILANNEVPGERGVRYTADFVVLKSIEKGKEDAFEAFVNSDKSWWSGWTKESYRKEIKAEIEIHETKAAWIRTTRIDWPLRRKWFKLKYGLPVIEIIQDKKGEITIKGGK